MVEPGDRIGYGGTFTARAGGSRWPQQAGDGYPGAANGTPVAVNGLPAVIAGRVSMDMLTIDVTDLPGVAVGDGVELWGATVPVERVAAFAGTIGYELTCRVSRRVPHDLRGP
jgi:alanine racemase